MDDNMQNTNNNLSSGDNSNSVGDTTNSGIDSDKLKQSSENIVGTDFEGSSVSPENVVIRKEEEIASESDEEKDDEDLSKDVKISTTKIEDREEDSESYMDDTGDY